MDKQLKLEPIRSSQLSDTVYELLRKHILHHEFVPGQRLNLTQLEDSLQVSRTPLKNALTRLEAEGLVEIQPRRGTFVTNVDPSKLDEAYKIRSAFELYVALCLFKYLTPEDYRFFHDLRCQMNELVQDPGSHWVDIVPEYLELDRQLHERLVIRGGTPRMVQLFQQMNVHRQMMRILPRYQNREFEAIHFEHEQIFTALDNEIPDYLSASLLNHLEASRMRAFKHAN